MAEGPAVEWLKSTAGILRRELTDHLIPLDEKHLQRLLTG